MDGIPWGKILNRVADALVPQQQMPLPRNSADPWMIRPGNIDLNKRPTIYNPDGSLSSVYSYGFEVDGGHEMLVPGVDATRRLSPEEAFEQYKRTGKHLGILANAPLADMYGKRIHEDQEKMMVTPKAMQLARPVRGSK